MTSTITLPAPASKTVREYVIAFVLPLLAIASVLAAHAANRSWVQAQASECSAAHHGAAPSSTAPACRQD